MNDDDDQIEIRLRVARSAFVVVAPPPATVTQKNVTVHFGISAAAYLALLRGGAIPFKKLGKLRVANYEDVRRYLSEGTRARPAVAGASEQGSSRERYFDTITRHIAKRSKITPAEAEARSRSKPLWALSDHSEIDAGINHAFGEGLPVPADILARLKQIAKKDGEEAIGRYFDLTRAVTKRLLDGLAPSEKPPTAEAIAEYRQMRADVAKS